MLILWVAILKESSTIIPRKFIEVLKFKSLKTLETINLLL